MATVDVDALSTVQANEEAASMTRRRGHRVRDIVGAGYRLYLLVPAAYLGWLGLRGFSFYAFSTERNWIYAIVCAGMAMIPVALSGLIARDLGNGQRARRATYGAVRFRFTENGISGVDDAGVIFSDGWTRYEGFLVGRHVIVCPRIGSPEYLRVPTDGLSDSQREEIVSLLSRHLSRLSLRRSSG